MNWKKTLAMVTVTAGLAAVPAIAQPGAGRGHGRMFRHAAGELGLTEQQKQFAKQLFADSRKQAEPIATELKQVRQSLAAAVKANNTGEIATLSARQGVLSGQLAEVRANSMAKFYAQLTPEQKAKADELREQRRNRSGERHGRPDRAAPNQ